MTPEESAHIKRTHDLLFKTVIFMTVVAGLLGGTVLFLMLVARLV